MSNETKPGATPGEAGAVEPVAYCDPAEPFNEVAFAWPGNDREARHTDPLYPQSAIDTLRAQLEAAEAEVARLVGCLTQANCNAEEFERNWYLWQDRAEDAEADAARYRWLRDEAMHVKGMSPAVVLATERFDVSSDECGGFEYGADLDALLDESMANEATP